MLDIDDRKSESAVLLFNFKQNIHTSFSSV